MSRVDFQVHTVDGVTEVMVTLSDCDVVLGEVIALTLEGSGGGGSLNINNLKKCSKYLEMDHELVEAST